MRRWGRRQRRLEFKPLAVTTLDELKRPGVVGGKNRMVTNAQHRHILQLIVEQVHNVAFFRGMRSDVVIEST